MYPLDFRYEKLSVAWLSSWEEYKEWKAATDCSPRRAIENEILENYTSSDSPFTFIEGSCAFCKTPSNFLLDDVFGYGHRSDSDFNPNWRERLICSRCNLNNRLRMVYSILDVFPNQLDTWITEQNTTFFRALSQRFTHLIGSEQLGENWVSGQYNDKGLRHESIVATSFKDSSLSCVITLDVLEHVEKTHDALVEIFRVLKPGGTLLATFAFDRESPTTFEMVQKNEDGTHTYFAPPVFRENPALDEQILCFRHFGWQVLADLKECGFVDAKIGLLWSRELANLGPEQTILIAKK
jgi:SAM-dependent methyltransferase